MVSKKGVLFEWKMEWKPVKHGVRTTYGKWKWSETPFKNHLDPLFFLFSEPSKSHVHVLLHSCSVMLNPFGPKSPCLVGGIPTPLKNMSSSVGMMKFQLNGTMKMCQNNQPDIVCCSWGYIWDEWIIWLISWINIVIWDQQWGLKWDDNFKKNTNNNDSFNISAVLIQPWL